MAHQKIDINGMITELCILFGATSRKYESNADLVHVMRLANTRIKWISKRIKAKKFIAAFVGLSNVGKSTLMNALFGAEIVSCKNLPWSSCPVEFIYGDEMEGIAQFSSSFTRKNKQCKTTEELLLFIEDFATEGGQHSKSDIAKLTLKVPVNVLEEGLVVADTPGFGAAQLEDKEGTHNKILTEYIPQVPQLFWIVWEEQGITGEEKNFYDTYLKDNCHDIIVNYSGHLEEKDKNRFKQRFEKELDIMMRFHFVNAKEAFKAKQAYDDNKLDNSGIRSLEQRMFQISSKDSRDQILLGDLIDLCKDLGWWLKETAKEKTTWPALELGALLYECKTVGGEDLKTKIESSLKGRN